MERKILLQEIVLFESPDPPPNHFQTRLFLFASVTIARMKPLIQNKQAGFNYTILDTLEAGVQLFGYEVKAIKGGRGSLRGAYVITRGNEAYLVGADIPPYQPGNVPPDYDARRLRKLLLKKKELETIGGKNKNEGLTVIPLMLYSKRNLIKVSLGIARGKKARDKRETIKKRETDREINRTLKIKR
jgi:SsrA-binding protein